MPAEVEAEHVGRPAQVRRMLDEVRRDRTRPAVEEQHGLARVGRPVAALDGLGGQPAPGQPEAVTRPEACDLAAQRLEGRPDARLVRARPGRGHQAPRHAVGQRPDRGNRDERRGDRHQRAADHEAGVPPPVVAAGPPPVVAGGLPAAAISDPDFARPSDT